MEACTSQILVKFVPQVIWRLTSFNDVPDLYLSQVSAELYMILSDGIRLKVVKSGGINKIASVKSECKNKITNTNKNNFSKITGA